MKEIKWDMVDVKTADAVKLVGIKLGDTFTGGTEDDMSHEVYVAFPINVTDKEVLDFLESIDGKMYKCIFDVVAASEFFGLDSVDCDVLNIVTVDEFMEDVR